MVILGYFVAGFFVASFVEYWAHRCMHHYRILGAGHRNHHAHNTGQGVIKEYLEYLIKSLPLMLLPFLISWEAGVGWLLGSNLFTFFSAYAHQLQHDNPAGCFWMPMPTHYVHHKYNQWHYNFGMAVDWWDRVFRTYKPIDWRADLDPNLPHRGLLQIRWW